MEQTSKKADDNESIVMQWNLYKADTTGAWKKCSLYEDVRFIEIHTKTNISQK